MDCSLVSVCYAVLIMGHVTNVKCVNVRTLGAAAAAAHHVAKMGEGTEIEQQTSIGCLKAHK